MLNYILQLLGFITAPKDCSIRQAVEFYATMDMTTASRRLRRKIVASRFLQKAKYF